MKAIEPLLLSFVCVLLQGCIGAGVLKTHTEVYPNAVVPESPSATLYPRSPEQTNTVVYNSTWLQDHWGKPIKITHAANGDETWTYKFEPISTDVMPIALIPIPIALPVQKQTVRFTLHDGRVISAAQKKHASAGAAYGFCLGPCGPSFGPMSLNGF